MLSGTETPLDDFSIRERRNNLDNLHETYQLALTKFQTLGCPSSKRRVSTGRFQPCNKTLISTASYHLLLTPHQNHVNQWLVFLRNTQNEPIPDPLDLCAYWKGMKGQVPRVAEVALPYIFLPVSSLDAVRSYSKCKNLLTNKRESLSEENTKKITIMYHNGDVCQR